MQPDRDRSEQIIEARRRNFLCEDCGHHLHRPNPGKCQWYDCPCAAPQPPADSERSAEEPCYRWEPDAGDCRRHHGPHKGFRCNGARGQLIEVYHERAASPVAEPVGWSGLREALNEARATTLGGLTEQIHAAIGDYYADGNTGMAGRPGLRLAEHIAARLSAGADRVEGGGS